MQLVPPTVAEDPWLAKPTLIRRFIEQRPSNEQMCIEVAYVLEKILSKAGIKTSSVTHRARLSKASWRRFNENRMPIRSRK